MMKRTFIELPLFSKLWKEAGLKDNDLKLLQQLLLENPDAGDIMQGVSSLRKIRWNIPGKGKRGGVRVCYLDLPDVHIILFVYIFKKNEKDNLTNSEKNEFSKLINELKSNYKK